MTRRQALALSLAGVALAPGGLPAFAQAPMRFSKGLVPTRTSLSRLGLEQGWFAAVPLLATERVLLLNLAGDMLFAQTTAGNIHAYESETGKYLWGARLGVRSLDVRAVSVNSDQAFATNGPNLICLDRKTGRLIWNTRLEGTAMGATAANEDRVMVGLNTGKLVAYNTRDKTKANPPGRSAGTFAWAWATSGPISARPVPAGRVVAFASQDGKAYVALENPHTLLYRYLTGGPIIGSLGTYGTRTLIIPSADRTVYAIDLFTGETKWTVAGGHPFDHEPLVDGDTVIALDSGGQIYAIDANNGQVKRNVNTGGGRLLALSPGRAYFESAEGDLSVFDRGAGRMLFSPRQTREGAGLNLREYSLSITNADNDRMYFGTPSGFVLCVHEAGRSQPHVLRDPKGPTFGYIPPDGDAAATPPTSPVEGEAGDEFP